MKNLYIAKFNTLPECHIYIAAKDFKDAESLAYVKCLEWMNNYHSRYSNYRKIESINPLLFKSIELICYNDSFIV
jgi:hypothetical protein